MDRVRPLFKENKTFDEWMEYIALDSTQVRRYRTEEIATEIYSYFSVHEITRVDGVGYYRTVLGGYEGVHRVYEGNRVKTGEELYNEGVNEGGKLIKESAPTHVIPILGDVPKFKIIQNGSSFFLWDLVESGSVEAKQEDYVSADYVV